MWTVNRVRKTSGPSTALASSPSGSSNDVDDGEKVTISRALFDNIATLVEENKLLTAQINEVNKQRELECANFKSTTDSLIKKNKELEQWNDKLKKTMDRHVLKLRESKERRRSERGSAMDNDSSIHSGSVKENPASQGEKRRSPSKSIKSPSKRTKLSKKEEEFNVEPLSNGSSRNSSKNSSPSDKRKSSSTVLTNIKTPHSSLSGSKPNTAMKDTTSRGPTPAIISDSADQIPKDPANRKYEEVVRNKDDRRKLHGRSCPCCHGFYAAVGDVPPILELGQVAPTSSASRMTNAISRHRTKYVPPATPPGYWDVDFPSTGRLSEINKQ
ncbi:hypothetical protein HDV05_005323 [Chytridiales sp. JEL 0842]|nr:hypothetical protein HDV05_005323 [Chytridiales sp. JEL 0842]